MSKKIKDLSNFVYGIKIKKSVNVYLKGDYYYNIQYLYKRMFEVK